MKNRLGIGARINLFDNTEQTVLEFNRLFPECPLPDIFSQACPVIIGSYVGADCREIEVAGETVIHKMFSDLLYGLDRDSFYEDQTEKELDEIHGYQIE